MTGVMWAVLNWGGTIPDLRDLFMMRVIMGTKLLECSLQEMWEMGPTCILQ